MIRCASYSGRRVRPPNAVALFVDGMLERSVIGSFSRVGIVVRRRLFHWSPLFDRLDAATVVVTGATSGLGRETAMALARVGARVVMVVRDAERGERTRHDIVAATANPSVEVVVADLGDLDAVRRAAKRLCQLDAIHVLVHNAGTLNRYRAESAQGIESTVAAQLLGPVLLTQLIETQLEVGQARVIWVTSGGMYTQRLDVAALEPAPRDYDGVAAYARVKRAQVSLVGWWAPRLAARGVTMVAVHPGWADTPGLRASLPVFRRLLGPFVRTSAEGADTIAWLATCRGSIPPGGLWLDRRARPIHRLPTTRLSDTPAERAKLWDYCVSRSGAIDLRHEGGE